MDDDEKTPWRVEPRSTENGLWALVNAGSNSLYDVELTGATTADTERLDSASLEAAPSIFNPDAPYRFRLRKPVGITATTLVVTWADSPGGRPQKQRITISSPPMSGRARPFLHVRIHAPRSTDAWRRTLGHGAAV